MPDNTLAAGTGPGTAAPAGVSTLTSVSHRTDTPPAPVDLAEVATASPWCQRWNARQPTWKHAREGGFDASRYTVAPIPEADAKAFVIHNHYSGSYPAAVARYGLFDTRDGAEDLVGVAVFGIPVQAAVLSTALPSLQPYTESQELSRFVLADEVPANGESWFLARCFDAQLAAGVRGVVSFADPVPRRRADGTCVAIGHIGVIYQASNATYTGRGTARTLTLLRDGTVLNARAAQKVRSTSQGHEYVEQRLIALGARVPRAGQDPAAWLKDALEDVGATRLRHRGAHRYVFRLGRNRRERERVTLGLPGLLPYPKQIDAPA